VVAAGGARRGWALVLRRGAWRNSLLFAGAGCTRGGRAAEQERLSWRVAQGTPRRSVRAAPCVRCWCKVPCVRFCSCGTERAVPCVPALSAALSVCSWTCSRQRARQREQQAQRAWQRAWHKSGRALSRARCWRGRGRGGVACGEAKARRRGLRRSQGRLRKKIRRARSSEEWGEAGCEGEGGFASMMTTYYWHQSRKD
jgi:hypothetical protein